MFLVNPHPLTVDSVTAEGMVGLLLKSLYEPLVATAASDDLSATDILMRCDDLRSTTLVPLDAPFILMPVIVPVYFSV